MFTKRIGTRAPALLAALLLGASGLAGCASDKENTGAPYGEESETYEPSGTSYPSGAGHDEDYYGGPFSKERVEAERSEGAEPYGERHDSGPWGSEETYGESGSQEGQTGMQEGETGESTRRNPFDKDY